MLTREERYRLAQLYLGHVNQFLPGVADLRGVWNDGSYLYFWPSDEAEFRALMGHATQAEINEIARDLGLRREGMYRQRRT